MYRIQAFKKAIDNYSADEGRNSVGWLRLVVFTTLATIPLAASPVLAGVDRFVGSVLIIVFPTLLIVLKDVLLTYNIIAQNYVTIDNHDHAEDVSKNSDAELYNNGLSREKLEHYMESHKPYLNPKLRIVELSQALCSNRTYLSNFINKEFGMNFSRFVNGYRLRELEKLRTTSAFSAMSGMELVQKAGFSSFNGYLRTKKLADRDNTLVG